MGKSCTIEEAYLKRSDDLVRYATALVGPDDAADLVADAFDGLSVRQRAVVFLTYWEDLDASEVGRRLDISEGAVKRHLAGGRTALREVLR